MFVRDVVLISYLFCLSRVSFYCVDKIAPRDIITVYEQERVIYEKHSSIYGSLPMIFF